MNSQDFCYWLQGFSELNQGPPNQEQWDAIKSHLALVFQKVTPPQHTFTDDLKRFRDGMPLYPTVTC